MTLFAKFIMPSGLLSHVPIWAHEVAKFNAAIFTLFGHSVIFNLSMPQTYTHFTQRQMQNMLKTV